ncbi:MAG: hypothetical protein K1X89_29130 [Myxococcaceae bacterium]|nr:hypothetical protein [Myxococcaceae bacterium]
MPAGGAPNYLKAAFLNVYNLSLLGGAAVAAMATGDWFIGAAAAGVEALWLLLGPDLRPFKRAVDQAEREARDKADRERVNKLIESLPQRDWQRAKALDELKREIERDMQHNPSFQAILLQSELDKLAQLHSSFVTLATACNRAETYLGATDRKEVDRQMESQKAILDRSSDPAVKDIAQKNLEVLSKRQLTIKDIENFLARARGQMNLIENSVRLLRDQALTMTSPSQLGEQLDDLLTGVDAIQQSAKDTEAMLTASRFDPISAVGAEGEGAARQGQRVREP